MARPDTHDPLLLLAAAAPAEPQWPFEVRLPVEPPKLIAAPPPLDLVEHLNEEAGAEAESGRPRDWQSGHSESLVDEVHRVGQAILRGGEYVRAGFRGTLAERARLHVRPLPDGGLDQHEELMDAARQLLDQYGWGQQQEGEDLWLRTQILSWVEQWFTYRVAMERRKLEKEKRRAAQWPWEWAQAVLEQRPAGTEPWPTVLAPRGLPSSIEYEQHDPTRGLPPCAESDYVEVRRRDGRTERGRAWGFSWGRAHGRAQDDIVGWRRVDPPGVGRPPKEPPSDIRATEDLAATVELLDEPGWIRYDGLGNPFGGLQVPSGLQVDVLLRSVADEALPERVRAASLADVDWTWGNAVGDVLAYRVTT
jgi:hypothetical protein